MVSETHDEITRRLIGRLESEGDIVQEDTGEWVFWPKRESVGYFTAYHLRIISDYLYRRNNLQQPGCHDDDRVKWVPASKPPPPSMEESRNFGSWVESDPVIVITEDLYICTGYYQHNTDPDDNCDDKWKECGRDGYDLEKVTHWRPLPAEPYKE